MSYSLLSHNYHQVSLAYLNILSCLSFVFISEFMSVNLYRARLFPLIYIFGSFQIAHIIMLVERSRI